MSGEKYLRVHRVVAERKIGRPISPGEVVHHIDGDIYNNEPENLQVMTRAEHNRIHFTGAKYPLKTTCKRGHPLQGENVMLTSSGARTCLTCYRAFSARWWRNKRRKRGLQLPGPKPGTPGAQRIIESNKRRATK